MPNSLQNWLSVYLRDSVGGSKTTRTVELIELEARVCFSASPVAAEVLAGMVEDGVHPEQFAVSNVVESEGVDDSPSLASNVGDVAVSEIVIIDDTVGGGVELWSDVLDRFGDEDIRVFVIDSSEDGIRQVTDILSEFEDVATLHIVSHGSAGNIQLGNTVLDATSLTSHGHELVAWEDSLSEDADILLYGCDVASSEDGRFLADGIAALTGADVAASDDRTGHKSLEGDWEFEYVVGRVESQIVFSDTVKQSWSHFLASSAPVDATIDVDTIVDAIDGDVTSVAQLLANKGTDGAISLREAIVAANNTGGHHEIVIGAGVYTLTLNTGAGEFEYGDLDVRADMTFVGAGADLTIVNGNGWTRVFEVHENVNAGFSQMTITGGRGGNGGGINVKTGADVSVDHAKLHSNTGADGGAIHMSVATLDLFNVSIFNNVASNNGGGLSLDGNVTLDTVAIYNNSADTGGGINAAGANPIVSMINTTVSGNTAQVAGGIRTDSLAFTIESSTIALNDTEGSGDGGLIVLGGETTLFNTIVAGNRNAEGRLANIEGAVKSLGFNLSDSRVMELDHGTDLISVDPRLNALQNNGSFVATHSLQDGSAAINAGSSVGGVDANGTTRQAIADIGAFESTSTSDGVIYWTDSRGSIFRGNPELGTTQEILTGLGAPVGLSADSINGKLYWSDTDTRSVMRSNLDGTSVEVLLDSGDINGAPLGLQVDPLRNRLYVIDNDATGSGDRILVADTDGSNLGVLVADAGTYPTDIAVDYVNESIYWSDPFDDVIYTAGLDGSDAVQIVTGAQGPVALDVDFQNQILYWTDNAIVGTDVLRRLHLETGTLETSTSVSDPLGVAFDNATQRLYWTQSNGEIHSLDAAQSPSPVAVPYSGFNPVDVSVVSLNGNAAPIGNDDNYVVIVGAPSLNVDAASGVLSNDSDADSSRLVAVVDQLPANADSFVLNPDGSFSYTPTSGFVGSDSFTYTVFDGVNAVKDVVVTLHVEVATVANANGPYLAVDGNPIVLDGSGSTDGPGQGLEYVWQLGSLTLGTSSSVQTVTAAQLQAAGVDSPGTYSVTLSVRDGRDDVETASTQLTIIANQVEVTGVEDSLYTFSESDFPAGVEEFTIEVLPAGTLRLNGVAISADDSVTMQAVRDGELTYDPPVDLYGSAVDSFSVGLVGANVTGMQSVAIEINLEAVAEAPTFYLSPSASGSLFVEDQTTSTEIIVQAAAQDGSEVTHFKVENLEHGTYRLLDGTVVSSGDFIPVSGGRSSMRFTPDPDFNGEVSFDVQATVNGDASGLGPISTVLFSVEPVNDAPVLDNSQNLDVGKFLSGYTNSAGVRIEDILDGHSTDFLTDIDDAAASGLVVHSVGNTNGTWQFSSDEGSTWIDFALVGITESPDYSRGLLLDEASRIRFVSDAGYEGSTSFTVRGWDQTTGTSGQVADTSATGNETAFTTQVGVAEAEVVGAVTYSIDTPLLHAIELSSSLEFSAANHNTLMLNWDLAGDNEFDLALSTSSGTITLGPTPSGTTVIAGANGSGTLTLRGLASELNQALEGLVYTPTVVGLQQIDVAAELAGNVLDLEFDQVGNIGADSSAFANNAVAQGSPGIVADADFGSVLRLDGNSALRVSGSIGDPNTMTLAAWINIDDVPKEMDVINVGNSIGLRVKNTSTQQSVVGYYRADGASALWPTTEFDVDVSDGWHHVAFVFDGESGQQSLYVDGVNVRSDSNSAPLIDLNGDTVIGSHATDWEYLYEGLIDDVHIFDEALTADEIASLALGVAGANGAIQIEVVSDNLAPEVLLDSYVVDEDQNLTISATNGVIVNDYDPEGRAISIDSNTETSNGTLVFDLETGGFTYNPDADFYGADEFDYTIREQTTLLESGSDWKYLDDGSDQGTVWRDVGFDDSVWAEGSAQLGFGDGDELTEIGFGGDEDNKVATTYFRSTFEVADASSYSTLSMDILADDGAIVYLNGQEFFRTSNMRSEMPFDEFAESKGAEDYHFISNLPSSLLVDGANTIAVQVKQFSPTSTDLSFDLSLTSSSLTSSGKVLIDVLPVNDAPVAQSDTVEVDEGTLLIQTASVFVNDADVDGPTQLGEIVSGPSHAAEFTWNSDGTFSYDHDGSETVRDEFTYRISDGDDGVDTATVTLEIQPVNDIPIVVGDDFEFSAMQSSRIDPADLLGNDTDAEEDAVTVSVVSQPIHGTITVESDGTIVYQPAGLTETGTDTFTYTVTDGVDVSESGTVTINLVLPPQPPPQPPTTESGGGSGGSGEGASEEEIGEEETGGSGADEFGSEGESGSVSEGTTLPGDGPELPTGGGSEDEEEGTFVQHNSVGSDVSDDQSKTRNGVSNPDGDSFANLVRLARRQIQGQIVETVERIENWTADILVSNIPLSQTSLGQHLADELDSAEEQLNDELAFGDLMVGALAGASSTFSVGLIYGLVRNSVFVAGLLSSTPVIKILDPNALAQMLEDDGESESVEDIFQA